MPTFGEWQLWDNGSLPMAESLGLLPTWTLMKLKPRTGYWCIYPAEKFLKAKQTAQGVSDKTAPVQVTTLFGEPYNVISLGFLSRVAPIEGYTIKTIIRLEQRCLCYCTKCVKSWDDIYSRYLYSVQGG